MTKRIITLGIANNDLAGACLVIDGKIIAALSEERLSRVKDHKTWPKRAIEFVLESGGITLGDVDQLAYGWNAGFCADRHLLLYLDRFSEASQDNPDSERHLRKRVVDEMHNDQEKRQEFEEFVRSQGASRKAVYIDHHKAHAKGAFLCSPFDDAVVMTCDGRGDFQSLTISRYTDGHETLLQQETSIDSIGYFVGRITHLLGFKPNRHEGKIVGLAAHGDPSQAMPLMKKMIDVKNGRLRAFPGDYYQPSYHGYSQTLLDEVAKHKAENIAAASQLHIENILTQLIAQYVDPDSKTDICLAGGVFANVKVNQRIRDLKGVKNIYVLPPMGDGGLPLQAAVVANFEATGKRDITPSMALGNPALAAADRPKEILAEHPMLNCSNGAANLQEMLIEALKNNLVIGTCRGRAEFGPRALGNRSILYRTDDPTMNQWLNDRLHRTEFMPFAPITAEELAGNCYQGWEPDQVASHYMTVTYDCTAEFSQSCPAVVHIDQTARPQIVLREDDVFLYELLVKWFKVSGQAALVNTSFNKHEEPIIGSVKDGLDALRDGVVDVLLVDDTQLFWGTTSRAAELFCKPSKVA